MKPKIAQGIEKKQTNILILLITKYCVETITNSGFEDPLIILQNIRIKTRKGRGSSSNSKLLAQAHKILKLTLEITTGYLSKFLL